LNLLGLCIVLWVKHPANNGFAYAKPFRQFRVSHSALAHGQIKSKLRRQIERNADRILAALQLGRRRNSVAADYPSGNRFGQAVGSLRESVGEVLSSSERFGQIREPDVKAFAISLGQKTGRITRPPRVDGRWLCGPVPAGSNPWSSAGIPFAPIEPARDAGANGTMGIWPRTQRSCSHTL
jgi:hypothetical protein